MEWSLPRWYEKESAQRLPFSRRERASERVQKTNDLAREAVGCNGLFGAPVALTRAASRMRRPHLHTITPCTTCLNLNHTQHTIRLPITGTPHNEHSYHTLHNGLGHATRLAQRQGNCI